MNENERREIQEAIAAADDALLHLGEAKKALGKARNWGIFDILGGGSVVGLAIHKVSMIRGELVNRLNG